MKNYRRIKPIKATQYKGKNYEDAKKFCKENGIDDERWNWSYFFTTLIINNRIKDGCNPVTKKRYCEYHDLCFDYYITVGEDLRNNGFYNVYTESEFISLYEKVEAENG